MGGRRRLPILSESKRVGDECIDLSSVPYGVGRVECVVEMDPVVHLPKQDGIRQEGVERMGIVFEPSPEFIFFDVGNEMLQTLEPSDGLETFGGQMSRHPPSMESKEGDIQDGGKGVEKEIRESGGLSRIADPPKGQGSSKQQGTGQGDEELGAQPQIQKGCDQRGSKNISVVGEDRREHRKKVVEKKAQSPCEEDHTKGDTKHPSAEVVEMAHRVPLCLCPAVESGVEGCDALGKFCFAGRGGVGEIETFPISEERIEKGVLILGEWKERSLCGVCFLQECRTPFLLFEGEVALLTQLQDRSTDVVAVGALVDEKT